MHLLYNSSAVLLWIKTSKMRIKGPFKYLCPLSGLYKYLLLMFRPQEVLKSQSEAENYRGILSYQLTLTTSVSKQVHA